MKKKIIIFSEFPLSALSGESSGRGGGQAATWLPQLARAWETCSEFEIHWAVFDRNADKPEIITALNQTFHRLPCPSISVSLLLARWPHRLAAKSLIRHVQPDLIHVWGTENLFGAALQEFDGHSVLSMQGIITTYFKTGDLTGWRWRLFRFWEPRSILKATVITCESKWGMNQVASIVDQKCMRRIEYGVSPSFFDVKWCPDAAKPRILFVGGLNRLKGIDLLINVLKKYPALPWRLVFIGSGYLEEELRNLHHPSVELLGMLKTNQVQEEMSKAWAFVIPSRADTSPNVVKEARVIGLPVIGSKNGGHAEYIDNGKDGFIVAGCEPECWYQALNALGTNYERCRLMGSLNQSKYREYFRPEKTADEFVKLYREMLAM
ncbi:MAG: glycosyltransferase family 1 protein [Verrucomicrobia bacterium]|nr:MAG: glycosyltransferase family 1 protein [Verrucomicrobiota bacterium]